LVYRLGIELDASTPQLLDSVIEIVTFKVHDRLFSFSDAVNSVD